MAALTLRSLAVLVYPFEWGVAWRAMPGQAVCGDLWLLRQGAGGILLGVIDGLGHGREALAAARTASRALKDSIDEPLEEMMHRCHERLRGTRGAVVGLARFEPREALVSWLGVGNVEAALFRRRQDGRLARRDLLVRAGTLGMTCPEGRSSLFSLEPGDTMVITTDGVGPGFADSVRPELNAQGVADAVLRRSGKASDDALVAVARYRGRAG